MKWTAQQIPDLQGQTAIVTGANSGIGFEAARELARHKAEVVLACRNMEKGAAAVRQITDTVPDARVELRELDLGSLASVRQFAERYAASHSSLDLLVNNAGVMAPPRRLTEDGFELQFGTNHLGHFALTGLLLPLIDARSAGRVVIVSSGAHRQGKINFDDLQGEKSYGRWSAYGQSKLANLLFMLELDRRLRARRSTIRSVAAHPGYAATNLQSAESSGVEAFMMSIGNAIIAQSAAMGALPTLYAATNPNVQGGQYFGPDGFFEGRGYPKLVSPNDRAQDEAVARRLWDVSQELTGVEIQYERPAEPVAAGAMPATETQSGEGAL